MSYAVAVEHLRQVAGACEAHMAWRDAPIVVAAYVFGDLLDGPEALDFIDMAFGVSLPPARVPLGAMPQAAQRFADKTRLDHRPIRCHWQPAESPITTHSIRQPVRIWSTDGTCPHIINLVANRRFADLPLERASISAQPISL